MGQRTTAVLIAAFGLGLIAFLGATTARTGDFILVLVEKTALAKIPKILFGRVRVLQEVGTSWIAIVPRRLLETDGMRGVATTILDRSPEGKKYALVLTPSPSEARALAGFGNVRVLDAEMCLFWTADGREAREALPAEYRLKAMSADDRMPWTPEEKAAAQTLRTMGSRLRTPGYDAVIAQMASQVAPASLSAFILALQGFQTRYASTPNCELAGDYLFGYFAQLGLSCSFEAFSFSSSGNSRNIVATLKGATFPEYVVVVGAHYDSTSNQATVLAPGADDNASGTAAVMEIARIFAGRPFDFTVRFVLFSAEEWGLLGSRYYAQNAKSVGEKLLAVINLDMIAYCDNLPEDLDLVVNADSEWLANRFAICARIYGGVNVLKVVNPNFRGSDHSPFWDQGYSALCGIEDSPLHNPNWHRTTDTFGTLNMDFAAAVTKIALAVAAGLAQVVR